MAPKKAKPKARGVVVKAAAASVQHSRRSLTTAPKAAKGRASVTAPARAVAQASGARTPSNKSAASEAWQAAVYDGAAPGLGCPSAPQEMAAPKPLQPTLERAFLGHGLVARAGAVVPFPVRAARVLPGGDVVLTAAEDGSVRLWEAATGQMSMDIADCHRQGVLSVTLFKEGPRALTTGADGSACILDLSEGKPTGRLEGHGTPVVGGSVYPRGDRAITMGLDGSGRIWDLRTEEVIAPLAGQGKTAVVACPDGEHVAVAGEDGKCELWSSRSGELVAEFGDHAGAVRSLSVFPDGKRMLTTGADGAAAIWDTGTSKHVKLQGHKDEVTCGAVSACSTRVMTGDKDGVARVWSANDGRLLAEWTADHRKATALADRSVHACDFFPDGKRVLVGGTAGASVWSFGGTVL